MKVESITKYIWNGKEYNSLSEIKDAITDKIGLEVIDKINRVCPPEKHEDLFKLLDVICSPDVREVLTECLNVTFEQSPDYFGDEVEEVNILDIK
jgi:hypothetical protein